MRVGTLGFVPGRLSEARAARRIPSMSALARGMSLNPSTVSRWEDGSSAPDTEALIRLACHLDVRQEYFLRPVHDAGRPVFLRSLASTLVRDLDYQRAQMRWLQEISHAVEHYVDLPAIDLPDVLNGATYRCRAAGCELPVRAQAGQAGMKLRPFKVLGIQQIDRKSVV